MIEERFSFWCADVDARVAGIARSRGPTALLQAWAGRQHSDEVGRFRYRNRFVRLNVMLDGRILIGGYEVNVVPIGPGEAFSPISQLFPGGLATLLSMNEAGAELAARAIAGWLAHDDEAVAAVRVDVERHEARALR